MTGPLADAYKAAKAATQRKGPSVTTRYVVLKADSADQFTLVATLDAANAKAAVAAAVKDNGILAGSYVATPVRSFKTVTVSSESKVHLKFT